MANQKRQYDYDVVDRALRARYGNTLTFEQLQEYGRETGIYAHWIRLNKEFRVGRGKYRVPNDGEVKSCGVPTRRERRARKSRYDGHAKSAPAAKVLTEAQQVVAEEQAQRSATVQMAATAVASNVVSMPAPSIRYSSDPVVQRKMEALAREASLLATVPEVSAAFVPFGDYEMIRRVIRSRRFLPCFIAGLSGNGKTFQVMQACAQEGREYIRVNITVETDEDDLIGGFRLRDNETVFEPGPVVVAMLRGAVLLLDEIDKNFSKIMCLQSVLEGGSLVIKKLGISVHPAPGFNIFATANTKGRGPNEEGSNGRFITSMPLDEAFLERFANWVEQDYPSESIERKILQKTFESDGFKMTRHAEVFFDSLTKWAAAIRESYTQNAVEDVISTRRLVHIVRNYELFDFDDEAAINYACNRFDAKTKSAFSDLYCKLAPSTVSVQNVGR